MAALQEIRDRQRRAILESFRDSVRSLKDQVEINEVVRLLETGNVAGVVRLLGLNEAAFEPIESAIREAYRTGGITGAEQLGRIPTSVGSVVLRFDVRSDRAERWLRQRSAGFITQIVREQQAVVRERLTAALAEGRNPRSAALDLVGRIDPSTRRRTGGIVGLTDRQASWMESARRELRDLNPNYLTRELRDRRLDEAFKRAIRDGTPMPERQIDTAITRLQARTERYRGEVIARTESLEALRAGQNEAVEQGLEEADVERGESVKVWDATGDSRTRSDHSIMDGQRVPVNEPFTAPDGSRLMFPGDTSLGAAADQTIQCRCEMRIEVDFGARAARLEGF